MIIVNKSRMSIGHPRVPSPEKAKAHERYLVQLIEILDW